MLLSRVIGYAREAYIAYAFGAGPTTDAYVAAFTLPDWLNYLMAGGTASITFISMFARYSAAGRKEEASKAFSVTLTVMTAALTVGVVLAAVFARPIERVIFPKFTEEQLDLCVALTRILLPAQIFFYAGGVVSAVLMSRRMFLYPALAPLLYNMGIILGGVLLGSRLGVAGLAVGALAGCFAGPFLINVLGAAAAGVRYRPSWDVSDAGFREWIALTIPLMLGVTLVAADEWILRFFASGSPGDITRLNYAKRLFAVPIAVLAQATAQASLPFFASAFGENRLQEYAAAVNRAVYRVTAASLLLTAWMMATAFPLVDLVYRRGRFDASDSEQTAEYFFWFALSLALWSAQALYARAFYAAGDTRTPMIAGTVITALSLPVYSWMFERYSVVGLPMASGAGILAHTLAMAVLLDRKKLVPLRSFPWKELAKVVFSAALAGFAAFGVRNKLADSGYVTGWLALGTISVTWLAATTLWLWITQSDLPGMLWRKISSPPPPVS
ncbi:MAG: murein biosynthesis integral membrane protein MurJ [Acidobacteria bacterium]|nr:murein biosynthesis integral membrane protein MurJ [Acidobacteriota bacterium]